MTYSILTQEIRQALQTLRAGDSVLLTGEIYTARDAAHKEICAGSCTMPGPRRPKTAWQWAHAAPQRPAGWMVLPQHYCGQVLPQ